MFGNPKGRASGDVWWFKHLCTHKVFLWIGEDEDGIIQLSFPQEDLYYINNR